MATTLVSPEISDTDPDKFMAVTSRRVIHRGGRVSTKAAVPGAGRRLGPGRGCGVRGFLAPPFGDAALEGVRGRLQTSCKSYRQG